MRAGHAFAVNNFHDLIAIAPRLRDQCLDGLARFIQCTAMQVHSGLPGNQALFQLLELLLLHTRPKERQRGLGCHRVEQGGGVRKPLDTAFWRALGLGAAQGNLCIRLATRRRRRWRCLGGDASGTGAGARKQFLVAQMVVVAGAGRGRCLGFGRHRRFGSQCLLEVGEEFAFHGSYCPRRSGAGQVQLLVELRPRNPLRPAVTTDHDHSTLDEALLEEALQELTTIRDWIRFGVTCLRSHDVFLGHGSNDPFAEATALVMQTLALEWSADAEILDARVLRREREAIVNLLRRRVNERKPLGYLLNLAYFAGHPFYVDERVLVPRSPIAELIEKRFLDWLSQEPERILDLCTGSGCIAIALAHAFPEALVDATDISMDALSVASVNVEHHDLGERVQLIESDLFAKLPGQRYDLIVSNPPYVDAADMANLPPEYLHEPELGLASGRDGLDFTRRLLAEAADYLTEDGMLVVEVGNSQWALEQSMPDVPFEWVEFERGGSGVFLLSAACCREFQRQFRQAEPG